MSSQRDDRSLNQLVIDNFQQIIESERLATVQCRHCHMIMTHEADQYRRRSTNLDRLSIQIILDANIRFLVIDVAKRLHQTAAMTVNCYDQSKFFEREYSQREFK